MITIRLKEVSKSPWERESKHIDQISNWSQKLINNDFYQAGLLTSTLAKGHLITAFFDSNNCILAVISGAHEHEPSIEFWAKTKSNKHIYINNEESREEPEEYITFSFPETNLDDVFSTIVKIKKEYDLEPFKTNNLKHAIEQTLQSYIEARDSIDMGMALEQIANNLAEDQIENKTNIVIDYGKVQLELIKLLKKSLTEFLKNNSNVNFSDFGLDCNAQYGDVLFCANTSEKLDINKSSNNQRLDYGDWEYHGFNLNFDWWGKTWANHAKNIELSAENNDTTTEKFMTMICHVAIELEQLDIFKTANKTSNLTISCADHDEETHKSIKRMSRVRKST